MIANNLAMASWKKYFLYQFFFCFATPFISPQWDIPQTAEVTGKVTEVKSPKIFTFLSHQFTFFKPF